MSALRIALISHSDSPWTPYYTRHLSARGHDVHVLSFSPKLVADATFHYVGAHPPDGRLPKWIYLWRAPRVARILRNIAPDVVLATYFRSNGLVGALSSPAPLVVSTRGIDADFPLPFGLGPKLSRWVASRASALHASSPELAEILGRIGVPEERFEVFPLGTDASTFVPRSGDRPVGPPRIICTRKHEPVYDNATIVRALSRLAERGIAFECRFVGSGSLLGETRDSVRRLHLESQVAIIGELDHREIPHHLQWADVYVSAAKADGAPSSLFEAMSTCLYPVVADIRANRDWIEHRKSGDLFAVGDHRSCADSLEFACRNFERLSSVTSANRTTVVERLDRDSNLARLEALLERTARAHSPR